MELGFGGEVADFFHRYRHGYPAAVVDALASTFGLTGQDVVVDLGCGTGQLALPMAARLRAVIGVDPEPDMLQRARQAAGDQDVRNVSWLIGADTDIPALRAFAESIFRSPRATSLFSWYYLTASLQILVD